MKKIYFLFLLLTLSIAGIGQQLFFEPFNYTPDATNGLSIQSNGTWLPINSGDSVLVASGNLSYTGLTASTGNKIKFDGAGTDYYASFTSQTSGSVYSSFILNVTTLGTTNPSYFTGFIQSASTTAYGGTVWVRPSSTATGKYNVGISTRSNSTVSWLTNDLDLNTSYFIVAAYDVVAGTGNDVARLWLNPALGGTEPAADATSAVGSDLSSVARVFLRQESVTNTPFIEMDEMRIGTTWASVTPGGTVTVPVPTTTSISPSSATAGGSAFTLTVNGTNFVSGQSSVTWNGSTRVTTFVSATQLTAAITAADIATAGTATVGVTTTGASAASNTQTFTINAAATPTLSATSLSGFGNTCLNTPSSPASFTLNGSSLTAGNITVGPLTGYTFSTSSTGTYTASLSLSQAGGNFTQVIYVKLTPTAVQSYSGNIPVSGGGATAISVPVTGAGVNTMPSITATAATSITTTGATLGGNITSTGCSAITAYGVEYSTTSGFANGSGTQIAGTNLASNAFTVSPSTLAPNTTYYYKAFATNAGGTAYSTELSFTTSSPSAPGAPVANAATAITTTGFTANWSAVTGATNYRLDVYTLAAGGGTDIAGWSFSTNTSAALTADIGNSNNIGIQTVSATGVVTAFTYPGGPTGTTGANPNSVSTTGWDNGVGTKYWQVDVNTIGASNLNLSSMQGSSNTGPKDFKVQYRIGSGGTWTDVPGGTISLTTAVAAGNASTWGAISNLALPAAIDNQPLVSIRWVVNSTISVNNSTVASGGTSRISAIYIRGAGGTGSTPVYVTGYQNLSVGNVTSYAVTGLNPSTTYYYVVRAENAGGQSVNSNAITVVTATPVVPTLTATTLAAFTNGCINASGSVNSFTLNGTNLTNANITVGPLAGFAFSTSATGPFTSTLNLTQTGGTYTQVVYVQFNPTAVQSYNGSIAVGGGGTSSSINVAATASGVNTAASVTTAAATAIVQNGATLNGNISSIGCSSITAYGFEYSTTSGFANGTGTSVSSNNLASGAFSAVLSTLASNTTYYYKAFATNAGGTTYGAQQTFTTTAAPSITLSAGTLTGFGSTCAGSSVGPNSFTITGVNLNNTNVVVGPLAGFSFSTTANGTYTSSLSLTQPGGAFTQIVFVKFNPTAAQIYNGNIPVSGGGAASINVAATGTGTNGAPTVTTGNTSAVTTHSANVAGSVTANGCSSVTEFGIEYSGINNFVTGTGTKVTGSGSATSFNAMLNGLVQGTTYYYRAYATNAGGTGYGAQQSFTVLSVPDGLTIYPVPAVAGTMLNFSLKNITPGYIGVEVYNTAGQQVYRKNFNVQGDFINDGFQFPLWAPTGVYSIRIVNDTDILARKNIVVSHR